MAGSLSRFANSPPGAWMPSAALKPARSVDIAAAPLLIRECRLRVDLPESQPPHFERARLDLEGRSRIHQQRGTPEGCRRNYPTRCVAEAGPDRLLGLELARTGASRACPWDVRPPLARALRNSSSDTVEVNASLLPAPDTLAPSPAGWSGSPPGFVFAVEAENRSSDPHEAADRASARGGGALRQNRAARPAPEDGARPLATPGQLPPRRRAPRPRRSARLRPDGTASSSGMRAGWCRRRSTRVLEAGSLS